VSEEQAAGVTAEAVRAGSPEPGWPQRQAFRYLNARFGPAWVYKAPETFENLVERWIWSVANGTAELGESCIAAIEAHCTERET
jgi:hypothetical protein